MGELKNTSWFWFVKLKSSSGMQLWGLTVADRPLSCKVFILFQSTPGEGPEEQELNQGPW